MSEQTVKIEIQQAQPLPLGAYASRNGVRFAVDVTDSSEQTRLVIHQKNTREILCEIIMNNYPACGNICSVFIRGIRADRIYYQYMRAGKIIEDIYGMKLYDNQRFGIFKPLEERALYEPWKNNFSWDDDKKPNLQYHDMVMYKLHVRGFSKHSSSGVAHKGTFSGIAEKVEYFKKLGINALVFMPVVDFPEMKVRELPASMMPASIWPSTLASDRREDISMKSSMAGSEQPEIFMNCWGYGEAQFFAPKASFAHSEPCTEFCTMVKTLHQNGIEVILELLFPSNMSQGVVIDCLRHWTEHYHVDGFWLNREIVPVEMAAKDPMLADVKLICTGFDTEKIYGRKIPVIKKLAGFGDDFQNTIRCFLKGDAQCLNAFVEKNISSDVKQASIRYVTTNNGFTLADLVAYNDKHNEENGEDNRDGSDYNNSWNCGCEGNTRSKKILALRRRQIYNAFLFLLFSQGTPMIYSGDEFGNSQSGNNNAYCHDNEIFWLNWRNLKKNSRIFNFAAQAIALRQSHPILHPSKPFRKMDYLSCGFPDVSVHGCQPWKPSFTADDRFVGIMYCGKYVRIDGHEDNSFYFAYNMHWEPAKFSLPVLPKKQMWRKIADTFEEVPFMENTSLMEADVGEYHISPRTIQIYMSVES